MKENTVIDYHSDEGHRTGIVTKVGRKFIYVLLVDQPLRVKKLPIDEKRYMKELDYPVSKAKRKIKKSLCYKHSKDIMSQATKQALK